MLGLTLNESRPFPSGVVLLITGAPETPAG
jgi:hypothetical protein